MDHSTGRAGDLLWRYFDLLHGSHLPAANPGGLELEYGDPFLLYNQLGAWSDGDRMPHGPGLEICRNPENRRCRAAGGSDPLFL